MKIAALKREADARAAEAQANRRKSRMHADRSLDIIRKGAGSTAGLAIAFSLGFMTGTGRRRSGTDPDRTRADGEHAKGRSSWLARGSIGEHTLKLGVALLAQSLTKLITEGSKQHTTASGAADDGAARARPLPSIDGIPRQG